MKAEDFKNMIRQIVQEELQNMTTKEEICEGGMTGRIIFGQQHHPLHSDKVVQQKVTINGKNNGIQKFFSV